MGEIDHFVREIGRWGTRFWKWEKMGDHLLKSVLIAIRSDKNCSFFHANGILSQTFFREICFA